MLHSEITSMKEDGLVAMIPIIEKITFITL
jgi:hypothetical protein